MRHLSNNTVNMYYEYGRRVCVICLIVLVSIPNALCSSETHQVSLFQTYITQTIWLKIASFICRFDVHHACFFTSAIRSRIVHFILDRKRFTLGEDDDYAFGIDRLIDQGVYVAAYPLHDVSCWNYFQFRRKIVFSQLINSFFISNTGWGFSTRQCATLTLHRMGQRIEVVSISTLRLC